MRSQEIGCAVVVDVDPQGFPTIQVDAWGEEQSGQEPLEAIHPWGFYGLPHQGGRDTLGAVDPSKCASVWTGWVGGLGRALPLHDPRLMPVLPRIGAGGSVQYGGPLPRVSYGWFDEKTGSYELVVFHGLLAHRLRFGADDGAISIKHSAGMSFVMEGRSVTVKNATGSVSMEMSDTTLAIKGMVTIDGTLAVGGPAAAPMMTGAMTPSALIRGL